MQLALAPMEGLVDDILRDVLTRVGGIDWCVTEFIRVNEVATPRHVIRRFASEAEQGWKTRAGTPLRLQFLGSDPERLAESAAVGVGLGAPVIDLNFGCPAKTVNKSRGGAILLREPELLQRIVTHVRAAVPAAIPVTAKMRLGYEDTTLALECARALEAGGAALLVVHARTKTDGYQPPAHWEWVARIQQVVRVPVYANGEIWSVADWRRCRAVSGAQHFMLGRGLIARPDLALMIRADARGANCSPLGWDRVRPMVDDFWAQQRAKLPARFAPGRLKQWLVWLARSYPEAAVLFHGLRQESDAVRIDGLLADSASPWAPAAVA
jgi:tRNA-dihydrouridine synthase C